MATLDPGLIAGFVLTILLDVLMPLVIGLYIWRRYGATWRIFWYGALVFFISQLLIRAPLVQLVQGSLAQTLASSQVAVTLWFLVLSLTAGLFEETGRYLGYRYLVKSTAWRDGLMFGAGHGGIESMLLTGGLVLLSLIQIVSLFALDPATVSLTPEQLQQVTAAREQISNMVWWEPLIGAYERFIALFLHMALSILVLQVFVRGSWVWYALAVFYHTIVNFVVVMVNQTWGPLVSELVFTVTLFISLAIIRYFKPPQPEAGETASPALVGEGG